MIARNFRAILAAGTALSIAVSASPAMAQLVRAGDLVDATDSGGNGGRLTVVDTDATRTDMTVLSSVVVANWNRFNVPQNTTVNIANGTANPSATLVNRVIGANFSEISGSINAQNIDLWLINQNGILFGDGALVNSRSFFASTIDVADQDLFDFYEGSDLFGNGASTLNFSGSLGNSVQSSSPNVTFVTDGSLMFVSESLNLNADFDAGSGRASFIAASDVSVTFTPGSPLTYVVNAGTTVADAMTVGGAVTGAGADFAMITAPGVVNAVLQVDATVTANAAVATDNGVRLFANQSGAGTVTVELSGEIDGTGAVGLNTDGDFTTTAAITGSSIDFSAGGSAAFGDLTATAGEIDIDVLGGDLVAGDVQATGAIAFNTGGTANATFGSLFSTGGAVSFDGAFANSISVAGLTQGTQVNLVALGALDLGDVTATSGGVSLSSINGLITADDISSVGNALLVAAEITTGDILASSGTITLSGVNGVTTTSVRATTGAMDIDSAGALDLGTLEAGGNIALDTFDSITTDAIIAGGALTVGGAVLPSNVTFTGNASAASITVDTSGAFGAQALNATAGAVDIDAISITADAVSATGGNVTLQAINAITTASISANIATMLGGAIDVDSTGGGALNLGNLAASGSISLDTTGGIVAGAVDGAAVSVGGVNAPSSASFSGAVVADQFSATVSGPVTFGQVNQIQNITGLSVGGALALQNDTDNLTVSGSITTGGSDVTIRNSGDITLAAGGQISGQVVALSAGDQFINLRGSDAVTASDRWIIYSAAPAGNTFGNLDSGNTAVWNGTFANTPPSSLSGNRYVFAFQPTLTVTSTDTSKTYGTDLTGALGGFFTVSGLQSGVAGAFLADTLAGVVTGAPSISSVGAIANADVAGGPYIITVSQGSLSPTTGYALSFDSSGRLTVTPLAITASVTVNNKTYDGTTAGTGTVTLNGVLSGDTVGTAGTTFTFADKNAGTGKTVAVAGTTLTGADAGNYTVTVPASALADILARLLVVAADDQRKTQGSEDPALTFQIGGDGLVAGDTLSGVLARELGEEIGSYAITQGTLSADDNYVIQFEGSVLTITSQPFQQIPLRSQVLPSDLSTPGLAKIEAVDLTELCAQNDGGACQATK